MFRDTTMSPREVQLTHLRAFVAVADLGSYTRAAERLGYSEPAVHLQVAALRRTVGGTLFERIRGRMHLTALGHEILPFAQESLAAVDALLRVAAEKGGGRGRLEIGVGRSTGSYVLPPVVAEFQQLNPEIEVVLHSLSGAAIVDGVRNGTLDFGLAGGYFSRVLRPAVGNLAIVPWCHFEPVLVATPSVVAGLQAPKARVSVLLPSFSEHQIAELRENIAATSLNGDFQVFDTAEAVRSVVMSGGGVGLLPTFVVSLELEVGRLERCLREVPLREGVIEFMHRRPATNPALTTWVRFLWERRRAARVSASADSVPRHPNGRVGAGISH